MKGQKRENGGNRHAEEESNVRKNYDPYQKDPGAGGPNDDRVNEADEQDARQREGVQMTGTSRLDDSTTAPIINTGQPGQTTRGSYGFNSSTGQGEYMDRTNAGAADISAEPLTHAPDGSSIAEEDLGKPDELEGK